MLDTRVMRWLERRSALDMHLSAVTIGELTRGVTRLSESRRRRALTRWIEVDLLQQFEGRILERRASNKNRIGIPKESEI